MPKTYTFTVTGIQPFPTDMLRYDKCWPTIPESVIELSECMHEVTRETINKPYRIMMSSCYPPSKERWESFSWIVK